jgi:hypothetical protein
VPTELGMVLARKRKLQAKIQTDITMVSVWFIICLVVLILLFADQGFAQATIEQVDVY